MENYFSNENWLTQRLGRFTSSECSKLFVGGRKKDEFFGQGAMTFIRKKAAEIITMEVKEEIDFKQAEWGKSQEPDACRVFEEMIGISGNYYGVADPVFFPFGEHAGGSPDWEAKISDEGDTVGADFKCPFNSDVHLENLLISSVAEYKDKKWEYYCQGQANMLIRGWQKFYAVSYDPRFPLPLQMKIIEVLPDQEWVTEFKERIERAGQIKQELIDLLSSQSVLVANYEPELQAIIIN
jgi:hypothetical protein